jgi:DNA polymerase
LDSLKRLFQEMSEKAAFVFSNRRIVPSEGSMNSRVALIGEAPGGEEEKAGRPFVGKAGANLTAFLQSAGLSRDNLYITNVVKIRPSRLSDKTGAPVNRPPNKAELSFFTPYLLKELEAVAPEYVVTLGNCALRAVTGQPLNIGQTRGTLISVAGRNVFPLYHPAAIIYNRELTDVYEKDMKTLKTLLSNA